VNIFNRIVMVLIILALFALVVLLLLFPREVALVIQGAMASTLDLLNTGQFFVIFVAICGIVLLVLLILLWLELRHSQLKTVRITAAKSGDAQLGVQSVAQSLENRIDELAGVRKVDAQVASHGKDVEVLLNMDTSPSVNVPMLSDQIVELTRNIVETQLGLKIRGKVRINIRHEPYPRGAMLAPAAASVSSPSVRPPSSGATTAEPASVEDKTWENEQVEVVEVDKEPSPTLEDSSSDDAPSTI
jgi:uncharacterized alkaline shock family protein YloU